MKWYYKQLGGHTHVRVFLNGAKCGDLCFRNEEFAAIRLHHIAGTRLVQTFVNETPAREEDETPAYNPPEDSTGEERQKLHEAQE